MSYAIRNEFDDLQWTSGKTESLDNFVDRVVKSYKFQLSDFDVFQILNGNSMVGHLNKVGDVFPCDCSLMDITRGGCKCGSLLRAEGV